MAYIKYYEKSMEINNDCVLFIKTDDMMMTYSDLLTEKLVIKDNTDVLNENRCLIISPITKIGDLFSLKKNNLFGKEIFENHQDIFKRLINQQVITECKEKLNEYINGVEENDDKDILKIIQIIYDINFEKTIDKKSFLTLINLFKNTSLSNLLVFNSDWIDEECVSKIVSNNIKTIFIFNKYDNVKKLITNSLNNTLILSNKSINIFNQKMNNSQQTDEDLFSEKVFVKL